jgi:hypothetical protein
LNDDENVRFTSLFLQSGLPEKAKFIKNMIFGNATKTVRIDKAAMDYYVRLTHFYAQFQAIGNNYNQTVRAVKTNFSDKRALALLYKLEKTGSITNRVDKKTENRIPPGKRPRYPYRPPHGASVLVRRRQNKNFGPLRPGRRSQNFCRRLCAFYGLGETIVLDSPPLAERPISPLRVGIPGDYTRGKQQSGLAPPCFYPHKML